MDGALIPWTMENPHLVLGTLIAALAIPFLYGYTSREQKPSSKTTAGQPENNASSLYGQQLVVPNLSRLMNNWPSSKLSPNLDKIRHHHDMKLQEWFPDVKIRNKIMGIDVPLFAAMWWPEATLERHLAITYYTVWLFVWDDHFDGALADPSLPPTAKELSAVHAKALDYTSYHLGLGPMDTEPLAPSRYSRIFAEAGELFRKSMTGTQRRRFLKQIDFYMECSRAHQSFIERLELPTSRSQYWQMRSGDSAYLTYCALNEYMMNVSLPIELIEMDQMQNLWLECMRCIIYVNDLLSLKKEMKASLCSLVPITMTEAECDLPSAVDLLVEGLKTSISIVEETTKSMVAGTLPGTKLHQDMQQYMSGMITPLRGNWDWSLSSARYGMGRFVQQDGSLVIPL